MRQILAAACGALTLGLAALPAAAAETITVKGEAIDTWCYFSGVMGGPEAVVGSAHHTCALWCAAGGIPVGLLAEDGTVYMVLKLGADDATNGGDKLLTIASHELTATGEHHVRDGVNYLIVNEVVADAGITNLSHEEWDVTPHFAIPDPNKK
ncbi:MAG: hypothetical protein AAF360_09050 [Pseudomonadota bacterium]